VFLAQHWQQQPLLRRGDPEAYVDLLTLDDVDRVVTTTSPRTPTFRLVRGGQPVPRTSYTRRGTVGGQRLDDLPDPGRVIALFEEGATIALQGMHRWWPPVAALCRGIEEALTHPVQANAYITPPGSRGLDVHHDTHDVIALQTDGRKHWVVHEPAVELPLPRQRWSSDEHTPGARVMDTEVSPGDALYLPRGTPHAAETTDTYSVHLTIGIRVVTWHEVLERAVARAADEPAFRRALPAGFATDPSALARELEPVLARAGEWLGGLGTGDLAEETVEAFWTGRSPQLRGGLAQLVAASPTDDATVVRPRVGVRPLLRTTDERLELVLSDRTIQLPLAARSAVERLLDGPVTVADLGDLLDGESRLVLVRRLQREGVLVVDGAGDA
jgi:bifunctional lysine-specific demethylase and histidyl-hydroxylase NO66